MDGIYDEAMNSFPRPSSEQVQQVYQTRAETEHAKCEEQVHFLTLVEDFSCEWCKTADVANPTEARPHDEEMLDTTPSWWTSASDLETEIKAIHPLSPPTSLPNFPQAKRAGLIRRLYRRLKCANAKAASRGKSRLQPNELGQLVQLEEHKVLQGIATDMQNLGFSPTEEQVLGEYDARSETELNECARLQSFIRKVKRFHRELRNFFKPARRMVRGVFCFGGSDNAVTQAPPQVARQRNLSPEQARSELRTALVEAIRRKNVTFSQERNHSVPVFQPEHLHDVAAQLEQHFLNELQHLLQTQAGAPVPEDVLLGQYISDGHQLLARLADDGLLVWIVNKYFGLPP